MRKRYSVDPSETFSEEIKFLKENVNKALYKDSDNEDEADINGFLDEITKQLYSHQNLHLFNNCETGNLNIKSINIASFLKDIDANLYTVEGFSLKNRLVDTLGIDLEVSSKDLPKLDLDYLLKSSKLDFFGCYLPMHAFGESSIIPWGIYIYPELIEEGAKGMRLLFDYDYTLEQYFVILFYAVYRHHLFHYQTERFATKLEIASVKAFYKPYKKNVYNELKNTDRWLEEALACASVLKSILIPNRIAARKDTPKGEIKKIYKTIFDMMPAGYKHYACTRYENVDNAHKVFAGQLIEGRISPSIIPTSLLTVKGEFGDNDQKVPIYIVTGLNDYIRVKEQEYLNSRISSTISYL